MDIDLSVCVSNRVQSTTAAGRGAALLAIMAVFARSLAAVLWVPAVAAPAAQQAGTHEPAHSAFPLLAGKDLWAEAWLLVVCPALHLLSTLAVR